jgi:hypothetical protein
LSSLTLSVTDDMQRCVVEHAGRESPVLARLRAVTTRIDLSLIPAGDGLTLARNR